MTKEAEETATTKLLAMLAAHSRGLKTNQLLAASDGAFGPGQIRRLLRASGKVTEKKVNSTNVLLWFLLEQEQHLSRSVATEAKKHKPEAGCKLDRARRSIL